MPEGIAWIEQGQLLPLIWTSFIAQKCMPVLKLSFAELNFGILHSNEMLKEIPNIC